MALNPKKHVVPHKHIIGDIIDGVTSNFVGGLIGGGTGGGGGYSGGLLNIVSDHESLKNMELIDYVWGFNNGAWVPHTKNMPLGTNHIKLSNDKTGHKTELFLVMIDESPLNIPDDWVFGRYSPILGVSTGMIVKKDITCGGYVGANQGLISLGSGMKSPFDPPGAWMFHSECKKINLKGTSFPSNPREGWRVIRTDQEPTSVGTFKCYPIHERQGNSWVRVGVSTFDNGYEFGASLPNWGSDRYGQWFITTGTSNNGRLYFLNPKTGNWDPMGDVDDSGYSGFFDTFTIRRAGYSIPLTSEMYAHLRCANITAHNTNPAADLTYGLGTPDRRWLGICADTVYADHIKDLNGDDFNFGMDWDGGTVHNNITILKDSPQLHLNATKGNPAIYFYDGSVQKIMLAYHEDYDYLYANNAENGQLLGTLNGAGNLSILGDFMTAGKIVLRTQTPTIDFAPPGLPTGQEYSARLINDASGWLHLYGHLNVGGDTKIDHTGVVNLNVNTTTANTGVYFNLQSQGNTMFMIGLAAIDTTSGYVYISSNNRQIIFTAGNSHISFWGPIHFGPATNCVAGNAGQVLTSNGSGNAPSWQTPSGGGGGNSWNGGVVTGDNITIQRQESQLRLNATSGSPALVFYRNGDQRLGLVYGITESILSFWDYSGNRQVARLDHGGNYSILGDLTIGPAGRIRLNDNLGSPGQVLTSNGNNAPSWQTPGSGGGGGSWDGGTVTNNITISRAGPQLHLNAVSEGPAIFFYNASSVRMSLRYSTAGYFYLQDDSGGRLIARWDHSGDYGILGSFSAGTTTQYIRLGATGSSCYIETSAGRPLYLQPASGTAVYATTDFYANNVLPRYSGSGDLGNGSTRWNGAVINNVYAVNVFPLSSNSGSVGNSGTYWNQIYGNTIRWRSGSTFACTPEESGKDWPHAFSDYTEAAEKLTHESTKTKYHVIYAKENPKNIVCTCGKIAQDPCPEHQAEWEDRYTVSIDNMVYAAGYMTLEHAAELIRLTQHSLELEEQNNHLEERVASLEQKLERLILLATTTPID